MERLQRLERLVTIVCTLQDMAINRMGSGSYAQSLRKEAMGHIDALRGEHPTGTIGKKDIAEALDDYRTPDGKTAHDVEIPQAMAEEFASAVGDVFEDGYWARCEGDNWCDEVKKLADKLGLVPLDDLDIDGVHMVDIDPDENQTGSFP